MASPQYAFNNFASWNMLKSASNKVLFFHLDDNTMSKHEICDWSFSIGLITYVIFSLIGPKFVYVISNYLYYV